MSDPLSKIKSYSTADLDRFEIRAARIGTNNSRYTSPIYVQGDYKLLSTILYGSGEAITDSTIRGLSFNSPYSNYTALDLVQNDMIEINSAGYLVDRVIDATSVLMKDDNPIPPGLFSDATINLVARDYLIEPDIFNNSIINGRATFTKFSFIVKGIGTAWSRDLAPGDSIQPDSYQRYLIINRVIDDETLELTSRYDSDTIVEARYTAKKWRLGRIAYQYVKNVFTYGTDTGAKGSEWNYDATTGSDILAQSEFSSFVDGIEVKFGPCLKPQNYPDLMDSNSVYQKTFTKNTLYTMSQYALPAVPNPEESLDFFINNTLQVRNKDYVISYSPSPVYEPPPPVDQRVVAHIMPLALIENVNLDPAETVDGYINFKDHSGNELSGVMPRSEIILIDEVKQDPYKDYVLDSDAGIAIASKHLTNEPVVKYVAVPRTGLIDDGFSVTLNGIDQKVTIPGSNEDDVLVSFEAGKVKPIDKDHPNDGDEYIVDYYVNGGFISDEILYVQEEKSWYRTEKYPIGYQSIIVVKNEVFLDEGVDYRVSYITGRVVLFSPLVRGDVIKTSYAYLAKYQSGISSSYIIIGILMFNIYRIT